MAGKVRQNESDTLREEESEKRSSTGPISPMERFRSLTKRLLKVPKQELAGAQKRHETRRRTHPKG
jgi:hypothetical protein